MFLYISKVRIKFWSVFMSQGYNANVHANYVQYGQAPAGMMPNMAPPVVPPQMNVSHNTYNTTVQQPQTPPPAQPPAAPPPQMHAQPEHDSFIKSDTAAVTAGILVSTAALLMCLFAPAKTTKPGFWAKFKAKRNADPIRAMKKAAKQKRTETKLKAKQEALEATQKVEQEILESKLKTQQEQLEAKLKAQQEKLEAKLEKKRNKIKNK